MTPELLVKGLEGIKTTFPKSLELLGVAELKDELAASRTPKIFIFDGRIYLFL